MTSLFGKVTSLIRGKKLHDYLGEDDDGRLIEWTDEEVMVMSRFNLKVELAKRNLEIEGNKKVLRARLKNAVREEKEQKLAYEAMIESKRKAEADLEASGSVYVVGLGKLGQLGLDETRNRRRFRCILSLRGKGVKRVVASTNTVMCLCDSGDVYAFGGGGIGHLCQATNAELKYSERRFQTSHLKPTNVDALKGEGVVQIVLSPGHGAAVSDGGDVFTWGSGRFGQLGLGEPLRTHPIQQLVDLPVGEYAKKVAVGPSHTVCVCESGKVYAWGLASNAQLGLGTRERHGVKEEQKSYFPVPTLVKSLEKFRVKKVCSGSNHVLALTASNGLWSWGSGDGGRLGHGDLIDRLEPTKIKALENEIVTEISAGIWHSAAVVALPPLRQGGLLYTWGSGYHGQLGLGTVQVATTPTIVECLRDMHVFVQGISCGSHHCALFDVDGNLYTWGCNKFCELGRGYRGGVDKAFTPVPGKVPCFGVFVGRIPRGKVSSVACGHGFTVVSTSAYDGPSEGEVDRMQEEEKNLIQEKEAEALRIKEDAFARDHRLKSTLAPKMRVGYLCTRCNLDMNKCPGFEGHLLHPHICKWCGHTAKVHEHPNPRDAPGWAADGGATKEEDKEVQIEDDSEMFLMS